jgi:hypothetical protein
LVFDIFSLKKTCMPKIVRLREVTPAEMPELERLVKKRTSFEARPARFILVLASLGRYKLSFEAQKRAVALVKTQALTLAGIIAALKEEKLVPKSETNGRYALTDTLKRAGLSAQREAACP